MGKEIGKTNKSCQNKGNKKSKQKKMPENPMTELVVSTPGTSIGVQNEMITIKNKGNGEKSLPYSSNLKNITFTTESASISAHAINWCIENNVGVNFFDSCGRHTGSVLVAKSCQIQAWICQSELSAVRRCQLAKKIILAKLKNQYSLLKYYNKYHYRNEELKREFAKASLIMERAIGQTSSIDEATAQYYKLLMSYESAGAKAYWSYIKVLLAQCGIEFDKRHRQGATDLVNCMLNYGYSILYSRIWSTMLRHQINPYDGVIHKNTPTKPVLVFDAIEIFRVQAVDRPVFSLLTKDRKCAIKDGILDDRTRTSVAQIFAQRQSKTENYRGQKKTLAEIIDCQINEIRQYIHENKPYRPYLIKW